MAVALLYAWTYSNVAHTQLRASRHDFAVCRTRRRLRVCHWQILQALSCDRNLNFLDRYSRFRRARYPVVLDNYATHKTFKPMRAGPTELDHADKETTVSRRLRRLFDCSAVTRRECARPRRMASFAAVPAREIRRALDSCQRSCSTPQIGDIQPHFLNISMEPA